MTGFLIYGANGYTGELVAREAKARGLDPILAGRHAGSIAALAQELALPQRVFDLTDPSALDAGLAGVSAVLNCAGPFAHTSRAVADGCLRNRVHYLDVTGEIVVFEQLAARDSEAKAAGVMLLPGVGFDVVPTDCLAAHLKRRLPEATHLALGFQALNGLSRGTAITTIEGMGRPNLVRKDGAIVPVPMGQLSRTIDFGRGPSRAVAIPWGDVATAHHSTGIPNIEVFAAVPALLAQLTKWSGLLSPLLASGPVQGFLKRRVRAGRAGPTAEQRARGRSYVWGEATDGRGRRVVSRLETLEGYTLTILTSLAALERVLAGDAKAGFQTPSRVFGADFILQFPQTTLRDE